MSEGGSFSSIFGAPADMEISHQQVATKLLGDGLLLTALELHTELLETGRELPRCFSFLPTC